MTDQKTTAILLEQKAISKENDSLKWEELNKICNAWKENTDLELSLEIDEKPDIKEELISSKRKREAFSVDVPYSLNSPKQMLEEEEEIEEIKDLEHPDTIINWNQLGSDFKPEQIVGATSNQLEQLIFLIKWKDFDKFDFVLADLVNIRYPKLVIDFYEKNLKWNVDELKDEKEIIMKKDEQNSDEDLNEYMKFEFGLIPERIFGSRILNGKLMFLVKWLNLNRANLVLAEIANLNCPHLVIEFYEQRIKWKN